MQLNCASAILKSSLPGTGTKKYWNQLDLSGSLSEEMVKSLIIHSYSEVIRKFSRRFLNANPDIAAVLDDHNARKDL